MKYPTYIEISAGTFVLRKSNELLEVLLVYRQNTDNGWTLPKGHTEFGESLQETALRETKEETGYEVELVDYLDKFDYVVNHDGCDYWRNVYIFLASPLHKIAEIKDSSEISASKWIDVREIKDKFAYAIQYEIVQKAIEKFMQNVV